MVSTQDIKVDGATAATAHMEGLMAEISRMATTSHTAAATITTATEVVTTRAATIQVRYFNSTAAADNPLIARRSLSFVFSRLQQLQRNRRRLWRRQRKLW